MPKVPMLQLEWDSNLKPSGRKAPNPTIEPLRPTFSRLTRRNTYYLKVANNDVEIRNVLQYGNCTQYLSLPFHLQIERYNQLLDQIREQLTDLEKGIKGLVVMSSDLEEIFQCIYDARVPSSWEKVSNLI